MAIKKLLSITLSFSLLFTPGVFAAQNTDSPGGMDKQIAELALKTKELGLNYSTPGGKEMTLDALFHEGVTSFQTLLPESQEGAPSFGIRGEAGEIDSDSGTFSILITAFDPSFKNQLGTSQVITGNLNDISGVQNLIRETANSLATEALGLLGKTTSQPKPFYARFLNLLLPLAHADSSVDQSKYAEIFIACIVTALLFQTYSLVKSKFVLVAALFSLTLAIGLSYGVIHKKIEERKAQ